MKLLGRVALVALGPGYSTTRMAIAVINKGHEAWVMTPGDFAYDPDEKIKAGKLAKGEKDLGLAPFKLSELTGNKKMAGTVPCKFLQVFQVTKDNLKKLVVDSGFQSYEDVYKDIPNAPAK